MAWYEVTDLTTFTAWHHDVCLVEGIPRPGYDQAADTVALAECWTDAYADAWQLVDGRLVIQLADDDLYATGLTPTTVDTGDGLDDHGDLEGATVIHDAQSLPRFWGADPVPRAVTNDA